MDFSDCPIDFTLFADFKGITAKLLTTAVGLACVFRPKMAKRADNF